MSLNNLIQQQAESLEAANKIHAHTMEIVMLRLYRSELAANLKRPCGNPECKCHGREGVDLVITSFTEELALIHAIKKLVQQLGRDASLPAFEEQHARCAKALSDFRKEWNRQVN